MLLVPLEMTTFGWLKENTIGGEVSGDGRPRVEIFSIPADSGSILPSELHHWLEIDRKGPIDRRWWSPFIGCLLFSRIPNCGEDLSLSGMAPEWLRGG
jgi:hypothetical protein